MLGEIAPHVACPFEEVRAQHEVQPRWWFGGRGARLHRRNGGIREVFPMHCAEADGGQEIMRRVGGRERKLIVASRAHGTG